MDSAETNTNGNGYFKGRTEQRLDNIEKSLAQNHDEILNEFKSLRSKVNEEITSMQKTISDNRKFLLRVLAIALVFGTFIWIKESREYILNKLQFLL